MPQIGARASTSIELSAGAVLDHARARSGLADLHEAGLGERLSRLMRHLNEDVGLSPQGRAVALETVGDLVAQRARLLTDRERYPDIAAQQIERPIFVAGFGRSGTTVVQMLLAEDLNNRLAQWWETRFPSPPPGISSSADGRMERADREVADLLRTIPQLRAAHPYFEEGGRSAAECEGICALDLRTVRLTILFRIPGQLSLELNKGDDPEEFYRFHRKVLQQLQWKMPPKRWVLKGVVHHARMSALKAVYPDAIVIWLHRDPQKVFPSNMELVCAHWDGITGKHVDRRAMGKKLLDMYIAQLDASVASPLSDHPDIYNLRYADFITDPVGHMAAFYDRYGLPFNPQLEQSMRTWLQRSKADRYGTFKYSLEAFGVSGEELEERASPYRRKFNIPHERAHS